MIYTVTLNPAMDCVMQMDEFVTGRTNRASGAFCHPGGKGVNVSLVLHTLGIRNTATGFLAGFTGEEIRKQLRMKLKIKSSCDFEMLKKGCTRINVKVCGKEETEINGIGAIPEKEDIEQLFEKLSKAGSGDVVVLAGNIPKGIDAGIYAEIMKRAEGKGVSFVVDTEGGALLRTLPYKPFLIKPNQHELEALFRIKINTIEEVIECGQKLRDKGARNVLVSMGKDGSVLLAEDGSVHILPAIKGETVSTVGAGDSMVAGFIAGWKRYMDYSKAHLLGAAAGAACAFSERLPDRREITSALDRLESVLGE